MPWCLVVCPTCTQIARVCVCVCKPFFNVNFIYFLTPWGKKLVMIFHSGWACDHSSCLLHWVKPHSHFVVEFGDFQSIGWIGNCGICDLPLHWVDSRLWNSWFPLGLIFWVSKIRRANDNWELNASMSVSHNGTSQGNKLEIGTLAPQVHYIQH